MTATPPISLWDATAVEPEPQDALGPPRCDVAIVGGGFTGLSAALHGAEAGLDCLVLEAERLGHGGSGRNVGLVNAGLWLPPEEVVARLGEARGAALIRLLGEGPQTVFDLIERHQIRCAAVRTGTIHAAHAPKGYAELGRRAAQWQRLGAPVRLLPPEEAAAKIGSPAFHGGLLDERAGVIEPMGYVRGLARAARGAGARVVTGAPVTGLARAGGAWQVRTPQGPVAARAVILATNAYADGLWPGLRRCFVPIHYFQLATPPLGARAAGILPGGRGCGIPGASCSRCGATRRGGWWWAPWARPSAAPPAFRAGGPRGRSGGCSRIWGRCPSRPPGTGASP